MPDEAISVGRRGLFRSYKPAILSETPSISGSVLDYFTAHKFATAKTCAHDLVYPVHQVHTSISYLMRKGNLASYKPQARGRTIFVLRGYNNGLDGVARANNRAVLKIKWEKYCRAHSSNTPAVVDESRLDEAPATDDELSTRDAELDTGSETGEYATFQKFLSALTKLPKFLRFRPADIENFY